MAKKSNAGKPAAQRSQKSRSTDGVKKPREAAARNTGANAQSRPAAPQRVSKVPRPNPFGNAEDIYITKNKIAVTKRKNSKGKRGFTQTTKTKYYEQNPDNLRQLKKVTTSVRVGRTGKTYREI